MTKEQWLVYLWSIYPDGGFKIVYGIALIIFCFILIFLMLSHYDFNEGEREDTLYRKLGWWKISIPSILLMLIFLSNLVPNREYFAYIIATPYVVDSGKSIIETLDNPNSKLSKLNQIMDKGLDKVLLELDKKETKEK